MTYCLAMKLNKGLLFAADSRTNAGVDHVSTYRKLHLFKQEGRFVVLLSAGNLATTQSIISRLTTRNEENEMSLLNTSSLYSIAKMIGRTTHKVITTLKEQPIDESIDFSANFIVGGQIEGEEPRLFLIYPEGNFIEAQEETPYFQIGESKYGKPIIDRVIHYETPLWKARTCALISFDSTIKSNLSVGLPLDIMTYVSNSFDFSNVERIVEENAYFKKLGYAWSDGVTRLFQEMPEN